MQELWGHLRFCERRQQSECNVWMSLLLHRRLGKSNRLTKVFCRMERCEICKDQVREADRLREESGWLYDAEKKTWICRDCRLEYCEPKN